MAEETQKLHERTFPTNQTTGEVRQYRQFFVASMLLPAIDPLTSTRKIISHGYTQMKSLRHRTERGQGEEIRTKSVDMASIMSRVRSQKATFAQRDTVSLSVNEAGT